MYELKKISEPTPRVLTSVSNANYTTNDKGIIILKNNPRIRLYVDKTLLRENGIEADRLELVKFDPKRMSFAFAPVKTGGIRLTPIPRSPKVEMSIPFSTLKSISDFSADELPPIKREPCAMKIEHGMFFVSMPLQLTAA